MNSRPSRPSIDVETRDGDPGTDTGIAPIYSAPLEMRAEADGSRVLTGRFPYNSLATIHAGGSGRKPRKERFAPKAFSWVLEPEQADRDIHLLVGHSFDHPLASRKAGTLALVDTDDALLFTARLTPEIQRTSWAQDLINAFLAGLITGISPGFRVAPPEAVEGEPETTEEEAPEDGKALIRTIHDAVLFELSLVTRPAYPETEVDLRSKDKRKTGIRVNPHDVQAYGREAAMAKLKRSSSYRWR